MNPEFTAKLFHLAETNRSQPNAFFEAIAGTEIYNIAVVDDKEGYILFYIGLQLQIKQIFDLAFLSYRNAREIFHQATNTSAEADCLINMGNMKLEYGELNDALEYLRQALEKKRKLREREGVIGCCISLSRIHIARANYGECLELLNEVTEEEVKTAKAGLSVPVLSNRAFAYYHLGFLQEAQKHGEAALAILDNQIYAQESDLHFALDRQNRQAIYLLLGNIQRNLSHFPTAIEYHLIALSICEEAGTVFYASKAYVALGIDYLSLGDGRNALKYFELARQIKENEHDTIGLYRLYLNLANAHKLLKQYDSARFFYEKARHMGVADPLAEERYYANLASLYRDRKEWDQALSAYQRALEIADGLKDVPARARIVGNLANLYMDMQQLDQAESMLSEAFQLSKVIEDTDFERTVLFNLGQLKELQEKWVEAHRFYLDSVRLTEQIGMQLIVEDQQIAFKSVLHPFWKLIPVCLHLFRTAEALDHLERSKSKALLGLLAAVVNLKPQYCGTAIQPLLKREEELLIRLRQLQLHGMQQQGSAIGTIRQLQQDLEETYEKLAEFDQKYVALRRGANLPFTTLKRLIA